MSLTKLIKDVQTMAEMERADADFIPAPSFSPHGRYLYVNCAYRPRPVGETPCQLLEKLRADSLAIMKSVVSRVSGDDYWSLCLSFYDKPRVGQNIRIYRISVLKSELRYLKEKGLAVADSEESRHPLLMPLLDAK